MIRPWSASSMRASFADSFSSSLESGMPVQRDTMNSMSSSSTDWVPLPLFFSHSRLSSSSRCRRIFSFSRSDAAFSNSWASRYMSFERVIREKDIDRKSTRLNSSHQIISYAVFCLKKKNKQKLQDRDIHFKTHFTV